jgi:hypothetical protein
MLGERLAAVPGLGFLAAQLRSETGVRGELLPLVAGGLDAIHGSNLSMRTKNEITGLFIDNLRHDATRRRNELLLMLRLAEGAGTSDRSKPSRPRP